MWLLKGCSLVVWRSFWRNNGSISGVIFMIHQLFMTLSSSHYGIYWSHNQLFFSLSTNQWPNHQDVNILIRILEKGSNHKVKYQVYLIFWQGPSAQVVGRGGLYQWVGLTALKLRRPNFKTWNKARFWRSFHIRTWFLQ